MQNIYEKKHHGFVLLFMTEMWERYGFYAVSSLLVLFLTKSLGYSDHQAYVLFSVFTALLFVTPMVGGYLADHYFGYQRMLTVGLIMLCIGYVLIAMPVNHLLFIGLSCIVAGSGLFKSMPYALLGKLYRVQHGEMESKFTLYYLSINIGGIPALLFSGILAHHFGWHVAFAVAAFGLVFAIIAFCLFRRKFKYIGNQKDDNKVSFISFGYLFLGIIACIGIIDWLLNHQHITIMAISFSSILLLSYLFIIYRSLTPNERRKFIKANVLIGFSIIFFALWYQMPMSLTLFIDRHVNHHIFGMYLPTSAFWLFNPVWILAFGPILSFMYNRFKKNPNISIKFGIGLIIMGIGYAILFTGTHYFNNKFQLSAWWIASSYALQALAELLVSALGAAMIVQLIPKRILGIMMGVWFLASSVGGLLAGKFASFSDTASSSHNSVASLHIYAHAFFLLSSISIILGLIMLTINIWLEKYASNTQPS